MCAVPKAVVSELDEFARVEKEKKQANARHRISCLHDIQANRKTVNGVSSTAMIFPYFEMSFTIITAHI